MHLFLHWPTLRLVSPCSHFQVSSECGANVLGGTLAGFQEEVSVLYLQIKHRSTSPHSFADLQVILLSGKMGRALVIWGQNFDIDRSNGWPKERKKRFRKGRKERQRVKKDRKTTCYWEADKGGRVAVKFWRGMRKRREMKGGTLQY